MSLQVRMEQYHKISKWRPEEFWGAEFLPLVITYYREPILHNSCAKATRLHRIALIKWIVYWWNPEYEIQSMIKYS